MKKKYSVLYILLVLLISLFIYILYVVIDNNRMVKYDDYKINKISRYLEGNSLQYDGIQEKLKVVSHNIDISKLDDIELNKQIASYVISNLVPNNDYGYGKCLECYRYFSKDDNIKFYNREDVDNIYMELFGLELKKITQEDLISFNVLYYNKDIDKYYINIVYKSDMPEVILKFKDYKYDDNMLYMDYYYSDIMYDGIENDDNVIYLYDMNGMMVKEIKYDELFNTDREVIVDDAYIENLDVIRYVFRYDRKSKKYILSGIKLLGN